MATLLEKLLIHIYKEYILIGHSPQAFKTYSIRNISNDRPLSSSFEDIFNQWPTTLLKLSRHIHPGNTLNGHYPKAFKTYFTRHIPNGCSTQAFKTDLIRNTLNGHSPRTFKIYLIRNVYSMALSSSFEDIFNKEYTRWPSP